MLKKEKASDQKLELTIPLPVVSQPGGAVFTEAHLLCINKVDWEVLVKEEV